LAAAKAALDQADFDDALDELDQARALRSGADIDRFRACVFLLAEDFETATKEGMREED
jgi:hypothetical protein